MSIMYDLGFRYFIADVNLLIFIDDFHLVRITQVGAAQGTMMVLFSKSRMPCKSRPVDEILDVTTSFQPSYNPVFYRLDLSTFRAGGGNYIKFILPTVCHMKH